MQAQHKEGFEFLKSIIKVEPEEFQIVANNDDVLKSQANL